MENDPILRSADYARQAIEKEKWDHKGGKVYFEISDAYFIPPSHAKVGDGPWVELSSLELGQSPDGIFYDPVNGAITWTFTCKD